VSDYAGHLAESKDPATSDGSGYWHIDNVPKSAQVRLHLLITHPSSFRTRSTGKFKNAPV